MVLEKPQDIGADGNFDAVASSTSMDATMDALGLSEKPEQILDSLKDIQETINSTLRDLKDLVDELN